MRVEQQDLGMNFWAKFGHAADDDSLGRRFKYININK